MSGRKSNSELVDALQEKRVAFEKKVSAQKARKGYLDDLVAGFSRTSSRLADLQNSVRTVCNRWGSEQLSQQNELWKLQQASLELQLTVKSCNAVHCNSPHHSKGTSPSKSEVPTRNVFAEVQLNGQSTPLHKQDPKLDRQILHSQLRAMINTSSGTLHTLPRLGQAHSECLSLSPRYEQSGLYIMVDPETGKPVGGQLVHPEQIGAGVSQRPGSISRQHMLQHSDQHTSDPSSFDSAAHGTGSVSVSARHSVCEPSGHKANESSSSSVLTEPIELLTPAIDQTVPQRARCSEQSHTMRAASPMPELSITTLAAATTAIVQDETSHATDQRLDCEYDVDEHGVCSMVAGAYASCSDVDSTCPEMMELAQPDAVGSGEEGTETTILPQRCMTESQQYCLLGRDDVSSCAELDKEGVSSSRTQQTTEEATFNALRHVPHSTTEVPHAPVAGEESQGHVHLQASSTSMSSLEVPDAIVGPIDMQALECDSGDLPLPGMQSITLTSCLASVQSKEIVAPSSAKSSLQFGDGDTAHLPRSQNHQRSSAILELLKEESDLIDDEPMSFMQSALTFRKGATLRESTKSPDLSGFSTLAQRSTATRARSMGKPGHAHNPPISSNAKSVLDDSNFNF